MPSYKGVRQATTREQKADDFVDFTKKREAPAGTYSANAGPRFPADSKQTFKIPDVAASNWGRSLFLLIIAAFALFLVFSPGKNGKPRIESVVSAFQGKGQLGTKGVLGPPVHIKGKKVKA